MILKCIQDRIKRIYISLEIKNYDGAAEFLEIAHDVSSKISHFKTKENKVLNKLNMIVSNLANLKDHLKNLVEQLGGSKQKIENKISESRFLQVIIDLNNAEKHGYPVSRKRSNLDPKIANIISKLTMYGDGDTSITINPDGRIEPEGNVVAAISADILDKQNRKIFSFDEMVEGALIECNQ